MDPAFTFVIDAIDAGVARLESDDGRLWPLPAALLPAAANEGDVLTLQRFTRDDALAVAWVLHLDVAATNARREALRARRDALPSGPEGDLTL